jgi:hypothetical protein
MLSHDGDGQEDNRSFALRQRPVSTSGMMQAIAGALAAAPQRDRAALAQWGASRLMLAMVWEGGFAPAAAHAYRMADALAGQAR